MPVRRAASSVDASADTRLLADDGAGRSLMIGAILEQLGRGAQVGGNTHAPSKAMSPSGGLARTAPHARGSPCAAYTS